MMVTLNSITIIILIFGVASAENVNFKSCTSNSNKTSETHVENVGNCIIHAVRITPCPEAANNEPCKIKKGSSTNIEFDYTPDFDAETAEGLVYWATDIDLPLRGMDTDACKFTTCPIVKDEKQTYKFTLDISKKFPARPFDIKWRLSGKEGGECCFITKIKLYK